MSNEDNFATRLLTALATAPVNTGQEVFHVVNRELPGDEHARAAFAIRCATLRRYKDTIKIDDVIALILAVVADEMDSA
jgi:hypothetical protein